VENPGSSTINNTYEMRIYTLTCYECSV
jgi:hypothetical protein